MINRSAHRRSIEQDEIREAVRTVDAVSEMRRLGDVLLAASREVVAAYHAREKATREKTLADQIDGYTRERLRAAIARVEELVGRG